MSLGLSPPIACTGLTAMWCPICGDCSCPDRENAMDSYGCPLHGPMSNHPYERLVRIVAARDTGEQGR